MKVEELKNFCKKYNIKIGTKFEILIDRNLGKKKEEIIQKIVKRVQSVHRDQSLLQKIYKYVEKEAFPDPSPIHNFYHSHFNYVDLADRKWYKVNDHHGNWKWKSKMLHSIMRMFMINLWGIAIQEKYESWIEFRENLALNMIQFH